MDAAGRGWGWSPGCRPEDRGLKVLGARGWGRGEVRESDESSLIQEGRAGGPGAARVPGVTRGTVLPAGGRPVPSGSSLRAEKGT